MIKQETTIKEDMQDIYNNCIKELERMEHTLEENNASAFLWAQYGLWKGYHKLNDKVRKEEKP